MIEPIFRLFQVQIKCLFRDAIELLQAPFAKRPETFDAVNMRITIYKFVGTVINAKMFAVTDVNQSVIAAPFV